MSKENYKLLIRNLRKEQHVKLKIQTTARTFRVTKDSKSIPFPKGVKFDNGKG
jgi:uncharacterized protein YhbP (UPF0306 family)